MADCCVERLNNSCWSAGAVRLALYGAVFTQASGRSQGPTGTPLRSASGPPTHAYVATHTYSRTQTDTQRCKDTAAGAVRAISESALQKRRGGMLEEIVSPPTNAAQAVQERVSDSAVTTISAYPPKPRRTGIYVCNCSIYLQARIAAALL